MKKSAIKTNQVKQLPKKRAGIKEELYNSEIRYRLMFEWAKDGILILDAKTGKIVDVNPFLIALLGLSKHYLIQKSIWQIDAFHGIYPTEEEFLVLNQKECAHYENLSLVSGNGQKIPIEFMCQIYSIQNKQSIHCNIHIINTIEDKNLILERATKELAETKKAAEELNKFTENIIDTIREPLLAIDQNLRVIKASRSFYNFFKVTPDETIGKLIYELGNHQWDIPKLKELLEKIIPDKISFDNYEVEHNFSTIGKRVMLLNARQVERALGSDKVILLAIEDITERKREEVSLENSHRATSDFLNSLLNQLHTPIIIWDSSMIIKRFNHKFELLSGYSSKEVINKKIDLLFPKEKIAKTLDLLKNHLTENHEISEIDVLTKNNNIKTVLWSSSSILDEEGKNIIATISQDITSRKHTENALILLEIRYRRFFESAKDGILILDAETGRIVDVNPFLIDLLGYPRKELMEKSIWEIGSFKDIYENKEKFIELQQKEYVRYDNLPIVTSDNREIHVEFISNVYLANNNKVIQCNIRDNTERTNIQNEIKFQADLINNVGQAVIATDLLGKITYWNNAAEKIYGWTSSEAIGENIMDLTPAGQTTEQARQIMENLNAGKSWSGEFPVKRKDGSSFPAFVTDTPILDANGKLTGIIGISNDITERQRVEMELIKTKEKAEESDRLKTVFLANMSHEIRTPMNGILGFAELLHTADLTSSEQQKYIGTIEESGTRLLNLLNDIIDISRIESGQNEITSSQVNINSQLEDIANFFLPEAEKKKLIISLKNGLPTNEATIKTDGKKVYAILSNLVKNAIKFTSSGSIELGYSKKDDFIEFYVKDNGAGIPDDQREMIFERFRQGSEVITRNYEGAGLGLPISKAYVEMLGGKIRVQHNTGKNGNIEGATFFFTIPA